MSIAQKFRAIIDEHAVDFAAGQYPGFQSAGVNISHSLTQFYIAQRGKPLNGATAAFFLEVAAFATAAHDYFLATPDVVVEEQTASEAQPQAEPDVEANAPLIA